MPLHIEFDDGNACREKKKAGKVSKTIGFTYLVMNWQQVIDIEYKKSILETWSLLEVKMSQGSLICEKLHLKIVNMSRMKFLSLKL